MGKLDFVLSRQVEKFIIAVIIINAITLGMETSHTLMREMGGFLVWADHIALAIFSLEIILKIIVLRGAYFRDPWNIFDFLIVAISYVPDTGGLSVLRSLRVLRILLLVSAMPRLRIIVRSLIISLPSIASIALLLSLIFYVCAVIATRIFGETFPAWFGTLPDSVFTLFQIMTLESWAMGIVRPVCEVYPYAAIFFVPFVLLSSFIILNIFIAVIINAMTEAREQMAAAAEAKKMEKEGEKSLNRIYARLDDMSGELGKISKMLRAISESRGAKPE